MNLGQSKNAAAIVRQVACDSLGMGEVSGMTANLHWFERAITTDEARCFGPMQRVNMTPGMHEMAKKLSLARVPASTTNSWQ